MLGHIHGLRQANEHAFVLLQKVSRGYREGYIGWGNRTSSAVDDGCHTDESEIVPEILLLFQRRAQHRQH